MTGQILAASEERWRSTLWVSVRSSDARDLREAERALAEEADLLEQSASRFRPDSCVSEVNANPGEWTVVSWHFVRVLTAALDAASATDGLVDPCVGDLVDAAGYRFWRDGTPLPDPQSPVDRRSQGLWRRIEIEPAGTRARVRIPAGCQLDLGATAKAWLADRLAARLADELGTDVLANMGGDVRSVALTDDWVVGVDPEIPGMEPATISIGTAGLATSGRGRRSWVTPSGVMHHIIDPRTGRSADTPWWSASVLASSAVGANSAATASIVLGDGAVGWLTGMGLDALLVAWASPDEMADGTQVVPVGRWPWPGRSAA